jgi:hypothetical protein
VDNSAFINIKLGSRRVWPVDRGCLLLLDTGSHFWHVWGLMFAHLFLTCNIPPCVSRLITVWYFSHFTSNQPLRVKKLVSIVASYYKPLSIPSWVYSLKITCNELNAEFLFHTFGIPSLFRYQVQMPKSRNVFIFEVFLRYLYEKKSLSLYKWTKNYIEKMICEGHFCALLDRKYVAYHLHNVTWTICGMNLACRL